MAMSNKLSWRPRVFPVSKSEVWRPHGPETALLDGWFKTCWMTGFPWRVFWTLFLIPQLLSFVAVYTMIKGVGLKSHCATVLLISQFCSFTWNRMFLSLCVNGYFEFIHLYTLLKNPIPNVPELLSLLYKWTSKSCLSPEPDDIQSGNVLNLDFITLPNIFKKSSHCFKFLPEAKFLLG